MIRFIDEHRGCYGVEPICRVIENAPLQYYELKPLEREPARQPLRQRTDLALAGEIQRVHAENLGVYGVRRVWKQLRREGFLVARCTVERLMRKLGLEGVRRGKRWKTTVPDESAPRPIDLVDRHFVALCPNQLWVADFTYVPT